MAGYIEDRWYTKKSDPETGKRRKTALYGKGKRWKVAGIPGVRARSFTREADAKDWLNSATTDTSRGTFYDPRRGKMTLREYVEEHWWPNTTYPPQTKHAMRPRVFIHILENAGHLALNAIGHDEIKAWQTAAGKRIDAGTLNVTWRHFSTIMQAAFKAKRVPVNPFRDDDTKVPAVPKSKAKAWPRESTDAVREELAPRYRILLDLALCAGLRQGEAFGFSPDDIDGEEIQVTRQVLKVGQRLAFGPPKRNKERTAPCPPELARAVKEYANEFPTIEVTLPWLDPDRPNMAWEDRPLRTVRLLVTSPRMKHKAINRDTFDNKHWKPALSKAGVIPPPKRRPPGRSGKSGADMVYAMPREDGFHVLRHTFASVVLQAGETITQLAAWLGHKDPAFTLRTYVHFMPKSGSKGLEALGRMLAPEISGSADSP